MKRKRGMQRKKSTLVSGDIPWYRRHMESDFRTVVLNTSELNNIIRKVTSNDAEFGLFRFDAPHSDDLPPLEIQKQVRSIWPGKDRCPLMMSYIKKTMQTRAATNGLVVFSKCEEELLQHIEMHRFTFNQLLFASAAKPPVVRGPFGNLMKKLVQPNEVFGVGKYYYRLGDDGRRDWYFIVGRTPSFVKFRWVGKYLQGGDEEDIHKKKIHRDEHGERVNFTYQSTYGNTGPMVASQHGTPEPKA